MIHIRVIRRIDETPLFSPNANPVTSWCWPVVWKDVGSGGYEVQIGVIEADDYGVPVFITRPDSEVGLSQADIHVIAYEMEYMRDCLNR